MNDADKKTRNIALLIGAAILVTLVAFWWL